MNNKLNIGILGSGNIGTDLLMKVLRSDSLHCTMFAGRNLGSPGMKKAFDLGVTVSDQGIGAFEAMAKNNDACDIVFDATSAAAHRQHAPILKQLGILAIDMTPSQIGKICVPSINVDDCLASDNINMITCGGQASVPMAHLLTQHVAGIEYIEAVSVISSRSAGPGTRANLDEYIANTEQALQEFTGCNAVKALINLNPAVPHIDMQTTIYAKVADCDAESLQQPAKALEAVIQQYVPGYRLVVPPVYHHGHITLTVKVEGMGDYLPKYAGNLDIINCAAIAVAESMAVKKLGIAPQTNPNIIPLHNQVGSHA